MTTAPLIATVSSRIGVLLGLVVLLGGSLMGSQVIAYGVASACDPAADRGTGVGATVAVGRGGRWPGRWSRPRLVGAGRTPAEVLVGMLPLAVVCALSVGWLGWRGLPHSAQPERPG